MKLRVNKNKLHQTDARAYKLLLHEMIKEALSELDILMTDVENGIILEVPHDELGSIPVEAKFIIKPLDYDVVSAGEQHLQKEQSKIDKEKERKAQAK